MTIPKIIHQIWMQTDKYIPETYIDYAAKNKHLNPNFTYMFWDEIKILELIKNNEEFMKTYYSFSYLHQKIDFAKYIILYLYGGIAIDMDAFTVQNLDKLFDLLKDYDVAVSLVNLNMLESYAICRQSKCVNNGIIISAPNADFMKTIINTIINNKNDTNTFMPRIYQITTTTGPVFINKLFNEYKGNSKIKILDYEYLEPCVRSNCNETENTYIKHIHSNTWINNNLVSIADFYLKNKILSYIIILAIIFILLFVIYRYVFKKKN
jgi:mannosyltransferase OCH1-like enzyme